VTGRRDAVEESGIVANRRMMQNNDEGCYPAQPIEMRRSGDGRLRWGNFL